MSETIRQFARKVLLNNKEEINANFNMRKNKKIKKFKEKFKKNTKKN